MRRGAINNMLIDALRKLSIVDGRIWCTRARASGARRNLERADPGLQGLLKGARWLCR